MRLIYIFGFIALGALATSCQKEVIQPNASMDEQEAAYMNFEMDQQDLGEVAPIALKGATEGGSETGSGGTITDPNNDEDSEKKKNNN